MRKNLKYWKEFINESDSNMTIPFRDEILNILKSKLDKTVYGRTNTSIDRANQLIEIHKTFIGNSTNKLSAEEIADSIFKYEINNISSD